MIDRGAFVTATGTDVGKTYVCCAILRDLVARGVRVAPRKPLLSGFDPDRWSESDAGQLIDAAGLTHADLDRVAPFRFGPALSPDMAALREGRTLSLVQVSQRLQADAERGAFHLVEGVGGLRVPIETDGRATVRELIQALGLPVVLVAGTYLGTLSHTLTAVDSLASAGLQPSLVVLSRSPTEPVPAEETAEELQRYGLDPIRILSRTPSSPAVRLPLPESMLR